MAESLYYPIYAKEFKDVPEWMRSSHEWQTAVAVDKLPKFQLKVKLCCLKCEEKVIEEIEEVPGVFNVRVERFRSKVVVVASHLGLNEHEVLHKARKIDRKAKFVPLDDKEKEEEKKKEAEEAERKLREAEYIYTFKPFVHWDTSPYYTPSPYYMPSSMTYMPSEYRPSQNYAPRYHYPPLPGQPEDDYFRQYVSQNYAPRYHYPPLPGQPEDDYFRQYVYHY